MSVGGGVEYISNVFRTEDNVQDDVKFGVSPTLSLSNAQRRLNWTFSYAPRYNAFLEFDQRNEWSQEFALHGDYAVSPRTRLSVQDSFVLQSIDSARAFNQSNPDLVPGDEQDTFRTLRNRITLSFAHQIGARLSSSGSFSYRTLRSDNPRDADSDVYGLSGRLSYVVTSRPRVGLGASYGLSDFEDRFVVDAVNSSNRSQSINGFVSGSYSLSPTSAISFSAGPAYIIQRPESPPAEIRRFPEGNFLIRDPSGGALVPDPDQPADTRFINLDKCPSSGGGQFSFPCVPGVDGFGNPVNDQVVVILPSVPGNNVAPGFGSPEAMAAETFESEAAQVRSQNNLTWFASGTLSKNWDRVSSSLSYRRSESPSSTFGTTTVVDSLSARMAFTPAQLWRVTLGGGWTQRSSVGEAVNARTSGFVLGDSGARGTSGTGVVDTRVAEIVDEIVETTDNALDTTWYRANVTVTRRFLRNWRGIVSWNFIAQRRGDKATNFQAREFNDYRIRFGLRYDFEPIYF